MGDSLTELRNNINFASISQFFHTFQSAFGSWLEKDEEYVFDTEDLEKMILDPSERNRLEDLFVRMLRLLTRNRFINPSTWQTYFAKEFDKREFLKKNPMYVSVQKEELLDFFTFSLDKQISLIFLLCEWQLDDPERLREHLYSEEGSVQWRVEPIGYEKTGAIFWLFDDNRLYLETPKPKKKLLKKKRRIPFTSARKNTRKPKEEDNNTEEEWIHWQLLCCTIEDWKSIMIKYADSDNSDEKKFHELLINELVPKIIPILEEREKQIKKQEAIVHRKRSSRIMIRELEALEGDYGLYESRTRSSNRIEKSSAEKEHQEKENLAKAREERILERERRLMEREYKAVIREKQEDKMQNNVYKNFETNTVQKSKRKHKEKFDEFGQLIPKKKRGRKPKNNDLEEDWFFSCVCGISGKNLDDGDPMIACEKCNTWQHIQCLGQFNQIDKNTDNLANISFTCQNCLLTEDRSSSFHSPIMQLKLNINKSVKLTTDNNDIKDPTKLYILKDSKQFNDGNGKYNTNDQVKTTVPKERENSLISVTNTNTFKEQDKNMDISENMDSLEREKYINKTILGENYVSKNEKGKNGAVDSLPEQETI